VVRQAWLIYVVGVFLIGFALFPLVGCSGETGSQPTGSQNNEVSQPAETGSEQTGSRESESTHELVLHGESIERTPNYPYAFLLKVNGITYDNPEGIELPGSVLHDEDLGPKLAEVSPEMNNESTNPTTTYSALPNEVPVYAIKGYDPSFRLAARMDNDLRAFEVLYNPRAEEGSDILDISGKVEPVISIYHNVAQGAPPPPVGSIDNPNKVERLLQSLMDAPIKPTSPDYYGTENLDQYHLPFALKDGTYVSFEYRMDMGRLSKVSDSGLDIPASGIVAPQVFREAIEEGVEKRYQRLIEAEKVDRRSCSDTRRSHEVRRADSSGGSLGTNEVVYTTNDVDPSGPWGGVLRGTGEKDKLLGEGGEDEIYGLGGDDTVDGGACGDKIYGGPGSDNMVGDQQNSDYGGVEVKSGKDVLYGEEGNDTLSADKDGQRDELYCGKGYDKALLGYATEYVNGESKVKVEKIDYVDDSCEETGKMVGPPA
jgi:hypothetical protein